MTLTRFIQLAHLWLGLLLGVQIMLWMASGVVMSVFDIALVRGERNAVQSIAPELEARSYANPGGVIAQAPGAQTVELRHFLGRQVYEVNGVGGVAIFNAHTGEKLSPISEEQAREIARLDYAGEAEIMKIALLEEAPHEYRRALPVWRADFDDRLATRLYISPSTGDVVSRRNSIWRVYDFFWMLHIMDYDERDNFNNPLLRVAAITGFLFALTGVYMVIVWIIRGRYRLPRRPG